MEMTVDEDVAGQVRILRVREPRVPRQRFATTRWSLVLHAQAENGAWALAELCRIYWSPVHAFIRGHGLSKDDADEVTQGFFEKLLARNDIARVDRARGRFRAWLRTCAYRYMCNWLNAQPGARRVHVALELHEHELTGGLSPERVFDRDWALTVLDRSLARLQQRYEQRGDLATFMHLYATLAGGRSECDDRQLAVLLGTSADAVKVRRCRLHERFRRCIELEVSETVGSAEELDDEIQELIDALAP